MEIQRLVWLRGAGGWSSGQMCIRTCLRTCMRRCTFLDLYLLRLHAQFDHTVHRPHFIGRAPAKYPEYEHVCAHLRMLLHVLVRPAAKVSSPRCFVTPAVVCERLARGQHCPNCLWVAPAPTNVAHLVAQLLQLVQLQAESVEDAGPLRHARRVMHEARFC